MRVTNVVYDPAIQTDIARINRQTGVLYLNPSIWKSLTADEREFVLLHEEGHLHLQTASEYMANKYAIGKYINVKNLTNSELGKRIQVVTEITDPTRYVSNLGIDPISNIAGAIGGIFNVLPMIGLGSKSRQKEAEKAAENQIKLINANTKSTTTLIVVGGLFFVVILVLFFAFKK